METAPGANLRAAMFAGRNQLTIAVQHLLELAYWAQSAEQTTDTLGMLLVAMS